VPGVFVNADGFKKSIPGPGVGNYVTVGKAISLARSIIGERALRTNTYFHAHGTGTPQNRVTESHIINEMAQHFKMDNWPVSAVKAYLGHSLASASGDQLISALGTWEYGLIPGIKTIDQIADDVHASHANYLLDHKEVDPSSIDAAFINAKGFGGNNSTASILSPHVTKRMLAWKYGSSAMKKHARLNESVRERAREYDAASIAGETAPIYHFGEGVVEGTDLDMSDMKISIPGLDHDISLDLPNPFEDMDFASTEEQKS
jgi:acetoacetyl-[acyl-carrier protein] synthase